MAYIILSRKQFFKFLCNYKKHMRAQIPFIYTYLEKKQKLYILYRIVTENVENVYPYPHNVKSTSGLRTPDVVRMAYPRFLQNNAWSTLQEHFCTFLIHVTLSFFLITSSDLIILSLFFLVHKLLADTNSEIRIFPFIYDNRHISLDFYC